MNVYTSEAANVAVEAPACNGVKLRNLEIAIASQEGIPMGIRAQFDIFIAHGLA